MQFFRKKAKRQKKIKKNGQDVNSLEPISFDCVFSFIFPVQIIQKKKSANRHIKNLTLPLKTIGLF